MGWNITCHICGRTDEGFLECDCYEQEIKTIVEKMKGCVIEGSRFENDGIWWIYQKLKGSEGAVFFIRIRLTSRSNELSLRKIQEVTEKEFNQEPRG